MPAEAVDLALQAFVALLVIFDPPGTAVMFVAITPRDTTAERRQQALRATCVAFGVMAGFALGGGWLLGQLGITQAALRVAGGLLLFLLAADMVMVRESGLRATTARERQEAEETENDISVFPLAIPLMAGPGAMTTMVVMQARTAWDPWLTAALFAALVAALVVTLAALLFAIPLARLLGQTGANVVSRVLGVVLAALAAQMVLDGIAASGLFG